MTIDPKLFATSAYSPDVVAYNALATEGIKQLPWPPESAQAFRAMAEAMGAAASPDGTLYRSADAETVTIPVDGGEIAGRLLRPADPQGLYVHLHSGGWTIGAADLQDATLERIVTTTGLAVVSVDYRLAPEYPFPVPLDDCEQAVRWLVAWGEEALGVTRIGLGGESAGATLALATAVRLARRPAAHPLRALNLLYGAYDLSLTPSARNWNRGGGLTIEMLEWFIAQYVADPDRRRDPEVSPLYAELGGLPPTLLTVGTEDPLRDDTLFLYMRMVAAGVAVELQIVPGAGHSFDLTATSVVAPAMARTDGFLAGKLSEALAIDWPST